MFTVLPVRPFAGLNPGRADVLRRALVKQNSRLVREIEKEFVESARQRGHAGEKIREVWELVAGFNGYAFCKAHSTAYGVEAYQAAWLKRYYPAEFMAGVLTNGKGFYHPLALCPRMPSARLEVAASIREPAGSSFRAERQIYSRAADARERTDHSNQRGDGGRTRGRSVRLDGLLLCSSWPIGRRVGSDDPRRRV
jgi:DNA polymerase III alpha subunit